MVIDDRSIETAFHSVIREYPADIGQRYLKEERRIIFDLKLCLPGSGGDLEVCDFGGARSPFSLTCAALGVKTTVVDDFGNTGGNAVLKMYEPLCRIFGVNLVVADMTIAPPEFSDRKFDRICCFHSMEHWTRNPRRLFQSMAKNLAIDGRFIMATPNCVNLRKRITIPLGIGSWSAFDEWYTAEIFRGHVREPNVADLRRIAQDMNLRDVTVMGRNWLGYESSFAMVRPLVPIVDFFLRAFPSLCSDLYVMGVKSDVSDDPRKI